MRNLRELPLSPDLSALLTEEGLSPLGQARLAASSDSSVRGQVLVSSAGSRYELEDELSLSVPADQLSLSAQLLRGKKDGKPVLLRIVWSGDDDRERTLQSLLPGSRHANLLSPTEAFELVRAEGEEEEGGEARRPLCLVYPVCGRTLPELVSSLTAQGESLSRAHAQSIFTQLADVLDHCERHDVAHRDVCPQNILVDVREDGWPHVYLIDFGTALHLRRHGEHFVFPEAADYHSQGLGFIASPALSDREVPVAWDPFFAFVGFDEIPVMWHDWQQQLGIFVDEVALVPSPFVAEV